MATKQPSEQNIPIAVAVLANKVDNLIASMDEVKISLKTQFQTTSQATADRREVMELIVQVQQRQNDGFAQIKDSQASASRKSESRLAILTGIFVTVSGGLLVFFITNVAHK